MTTPNYDEILDALGRSARIMEAYHGSESARLLREAADIVREQQEDRNTIQKAKDDLTKLVHGE